MLYFSQTFWISVWLLLVLIFVKTWASRRFRGLRLPPGPPSLPVFGNLLQLAHPLYTTFNQLASKYGDVMLLWFGYKPVVVISSARALKLYYQQNGRAFTDRPHSFYFNSVSSHFKHGFFASNGAGWRNSRRIATQLLLAKTRIPDHEGFIRDASREFLLEGDFPQVIKNGAFSTWNQFFRQMLFASILRICVGEALEGPKDPAIARYVDAVRALSSVADRPYYGDFIPLFEYLPSAFRTGVVKNLEEEHRVMAEFVQMAKARYLSGKPSKCMAHLLFEQAKQEPDHLTDKEIEYILNDAVDAAVDTTSATLEWAVFGLANEYEVQDRLRAEIEGVLGTEDFTLEHASQMPYLNAFLLEAMRFGPFDPVPPARWCTQAVKIDGYDIPEGTTIMTNMHSLMHDPEIFPDADVFRPERFFERSFGEVTSGSSPEFAPFSVGPRMCPGAALAMLDMSSIITMLVQNYKLTRPTEARIEATVSSGLVASPEPPPAIHVTRIIPSTH